MTLPNEGSGDASETSPLRRESTNLGILAAQLIIMRIGWIFKTESVIIPHVLDVISGNAAWARGFLPVLNRLGQSLPPLLAADFIRDIRLKKRALIYTTLGMALPFLILAGVWSLLQNRSQPWLVVLFLVLYFVFFSATGLNQLVDGTLQGKLIRPERRGRLLGIAGVIGAAGAVCAAYFLLRPWIQLPNHDGFVYIFLFNGSAYVIAGLMANLCSEQPDEPLADQIERPPWWTPFVRAWQTFRDDQRFRRAAWMATLFMSGLLLFPHYQSMARELLGTSHTDIIWWVIAQNISVGLLSPFFGGIADRYGNRIALRIAAFLAALTPLIAVLLASSWFPFGRQWFWITYVFLGVTPVTMKTIVNYTLELVPRERHPQYLSTMTIFYTVPFLLSPLLGVVIDLIPWQLPFLVISGIIACGGLLTFRMADHGTVRELMLIAFNKPYGVLSQFTSDGSSNRPLATFGFPKNIYPIGRLDADSEGLLLLSDEPAWNARLLEPRHAHEREYWVQVERIPDAEDLAQLAAGVLVQGRKTLPCRAWLPEPQPEIPPRDPPIRFRKNVPDCWIVMELIEGKNRQVRRMTAAIGHPTLRLMRSRIGQLTLGKLLPGEWKILTPQERMLAAGDDPV